MLSNYKFLTLKKKIIKRNNFIKKGGKYTSQNTFKKKIKLKQELENIIAKNELKIEKKLEFLNNIEKPKSNINIENLNKEKKSSIQMPSIQLLNIYLFISKSVLCIFILPFIKNNFNFKDSMDDMIENMYNCIFTMEFFKRNFNSIIAVIDGLGNIFKPYKELKKLFTYKKNNNNKSLEYVIKNCFYSLMSYETLMKIEILIKLYKNKDFLFQGNLIQNASDTNYLISGILTLLELVLCSNDNKSHAICNYISPFNYITLYVPYILKAIELSSKLIGLYKNNNIELQNLIEDKGFLNVILTFLCINIDFYNEEKKKEIKKTIEIKKSKYNFFNTIKNTIKNNKRKISAVILGTGALMLGLNYINKNKKIYDNNNTSSDTDLSLESDSNSSPDSYINPDFIDTELNKKPSIEEIITIKKNLEKEKNIYISAKNKKTNKLVPIHEVQKQHLEFLKIQEKIKNKKSYFDDMNMKLLEYQASLF